MNSSIRYVKEKICLILQEIEKNEYSISKADMIRILEGIKNAKIYFEDEDIYAYSENNTKYKCNSQSINSSCVLEFYPKKTDTKFVSIYPILYLIKFENPEVYLSTLYHEICHLISIGPWSKISENKISHISGVSEKEYIYGERFIENGLDINNVNEEVNDFVAKKIYEEIEKKSYYSNKRPQLNRCQGYIQNQINYKLNGDYKKLIGYYFSNNIEEINNILVSERFKNIQELNDYFSLENYKKEIQDNNELSRN